MKEIAVIGLGYVGLPLAVEFGKYREVVGFDVNEKRVRSLKNNQDWTAEVGREELESAKLLTYSSDLNDIKDCKIYIVTVPTPIDQYNKPDLKPLLGACEMVGTLLKKGDLIIFESTVYPGCTEDDCVPVLERKSQLKFNVDFFCGYSPERINPGDKKHRLVTIKKVTSGSTPEIASEVDGLYKEIVKAGTHKASSIKVAEAAKVIENAQRDVNIAFVNELAIIFNKLGIDTTEVLEAAGSKWNFLPFKPGLVGGHCIGVDPYYLTQKAESIGYHPEVILAGRRINDNMGLFITNEVVKLLNKKDHPIKNSTVLVLGITFKENTPDIRNSKVIDIVSELDEFGISVDVFDPFANKEEVKDEYGISLIDEISTKYNGIVLAVAHNSFKDLDYKEYLKPGGVLYDVKSYLDRDLVDARL